MDQEILLRRNLMIQKVNDKIGKIGTSAGSSTVNEFGIVNTTGNSVQNERIRTSLVEDIIVGKHDLDIMHGDPEVKADKLIQIKKDNGE